MSLSLTELGEEWCQHPLGKHRAAGGLNALDGFAFQIGVSLEEFIDRVRAGGVDAELAFETLSDLSAAGGGRYYLTQVKTTLTAVTAVSVAQEAMAVDAFLAQCHPELREAFSYAVCCRAWRSGDPRKVSAARLGLVRKEAARWEELKARICPPEVRSDPRLRLALKLFYEVPEPFGLIASMTGQLLQLLSNRSSPTEVSAKLLAMWAAARAALKVEPPPKLLDLDDFAPGPIGKEISLGQRPTLSATREGVLHAAARPRIRGGQLHRGRGCFDQ